MVLITTAMMLCLGNTQSHVLDISKLTSTDIASVKGYDLDLDSGGPVPVAEIEKQSNLVKEVYKIRMAFSLSTAQKSHRKYSGNLLRMKIGLKDGRSILVDQEGYFLLCSKDMRSKAEYGMKRIQYMSFAVMWHDAILRSKGLLKE